MLLLKISPKLKPGSFLLGHHTRQTGKLIAMLQSIKSCNHPDEFAERWSLTNTCFALAQVVERFRLARSRPDHGNPEWLPQPLLEDRSQDDAFATILQWLSSRIPDTR